MVEFRKLIAFGKSSYVVSLPKKWVERNKLKRGDNIWVDVKKEKLVLSSKLEKENKQDKTITIFIDGKSDKDILRNIISAYINNYKNIILSGKELKDKSIVIREILHGLLALEIMEQTSNKMISRDFLDMNTVDIKGVLRKMDNITRSMLIDMKSCFDEKKAAHISDMDKDINRLSYLLYRAIKYKMNNPSPDKQFYMSNIDLLIAWQYGKLIEDICDNIKRISRVVEGVKFKKQEPVVKELFNDFRNLYTNTLKAFYEKNKESALKLAHSKAKIIEKCNKLCEQKLNPDLVVVIERIRSSTEIIHYLGRLIYS